MIHDVNMSNINLNTIMQPFLDKLAMLTDTVQELKAQVVLMQLSTPTSIDTHNKPENGSELHTESSAKSEKWLNPPMYKGIWKNLQPFVSKLQSKLQ